MSSVQVFPPFEVFTGTDGKPLESGYIFIGQANLNPETAQIPVFYDVGLTEPAPQPIRTISGYPSRAGTPARLYVASSTYSITVKDKHQVVVFTLLNSQTASQLQSDLSGQNGSTMVFRGDRSLDEKWLEDASIFDFMTAAQRADALTGTPSLDHTVPVQNAFAAIGVTIRSLKVNDGAVFRVNNSCNITNKSSFRITGKGQIKQFTANKPILILTSCSFFDIEGPRFYGLGTDFTPLADTGIGDGIYANLCNNWSVTHCEFTNFGSAGVRTRDGNNFRIEDNTITGTFGISAPIATGDLYQFPIIIQSNWLTGTGPNNFSVKRNNCSNTAIGIRIEPMARRFQVHENNVFDIRGQHGMYINGQKFSVLGNIVDNVQFVAIKTQSFHLGANPFTDPIVDAVIANNVINVCQSGIHVEKVDSLSAKSHRVVIANNVINNNNAIGEPIHVEDTDGLVITGNTCQGGRYNIIATTLTTGQACSGVIRGNVCKDAIRAGIFGFTDDTLEIGGNTIVRPCSGAVGGAGNEDAIFIAGTTTSKRGHVHDNTVFVDTSIGVASGLRAEIIALNLGANDLDNKPIVTAGGTTIRKRTIGADFVGSQLWGASPIIASGASAAITITVTGAALGDFVSAISHASDLQGCTLDAEITATDTLTVVITNLTGGSKTITDGTVRWNVMRFGV